MAPRRSSKAGQLYGCGMAKGGLLPSFLSAGSVDAEGDCSFPTKLVINLKGIADGFVRISCDLNTFSALDSSGNLWLWGVNDRVGLPVVPTRLVSTPGTTTAISFIDCSSGQGFVTAVTTAGNVLLIGTCSHLKTQVQEAAAFRGKFECSQVVLPSAIQAGGDDPVVVCEACNRDMVLLSRKGKLFAVKADGVRQLPNISSPVSVVALGSLFGAAVSTDGQSLWVWGDGLSGNFGVGKRVCSKEPIEVGEFFRTRGLSIADVKCTRGQPGCKRDGKPSAGQEGPRMHVVTSDGSLYVAGTSHKGLCADHLWKVMQPAQDQLTFYLVGSAAQDASQAASASAPPHTTSSTATPAPATAHMPDGTLFRSSTPSDPSTRHPADAGSTTHADRGLSCPPPPTLSQKTKATTSKGVPLARSGSGHGLPVPTGAAEDLLRSNCRWRCSAAEAAWRMGMAAGDCAFGSTRDTGYLRDCAVVCAEAASIHSLALAEDGRVFAWGCGSDGRTGLRAYLRGPGGSKRKLKCYVSTPTAELSRALFVAAGRYWSFFIVDEGEKRPPPADRVAHTRGAPVEASSSADAVASPSEDPATAKS